MKYEVGNPSDKCFVFADDMDQPNYSPGDHVRIRNDLGEWEEAWIVDVIPIYKYTIRLKPDEYYDGSKIIGVFKSDKDIRPFGGPHG